LEGVGAQNLEPVNIHRPKLPSIRDVPFCFTDATVLPSGQIAFCAVAEDTDDAYNDGACVGAGIGILDEDLRLVFFQELTRPHKIEGIDARIRDGRIEVLMVTDADDRTRPGSLLSASL
jgi:hypothetical protein